MPSRWNRRQADRFCRSSRLLKKTHMLRCRSIASLQRNVSTPPLVDFSRASHLDLFEQPARGFFSTLLESAVSGRAWKLKRSLKLVVAPLLKVEKASGSFSFSGNFASIVHSCLFGRALTNIEYQTESHSMFAILNLEVAIRRLNVDHLNGCDCPSSRISLQGLHTL